MKILSCILFLFLIVTSVLGSEKSSAASLGDVTNHASSKMRRQKSSQQGLSPLDEEDPSGRSSRPKPYDRGTSGPSATSEDNDLGELALSLGESRLGFVSNITGKILKLQPAPKGKRRSRTPSTSSSQTDDSLSVECSKPDKPPS